MTDGRHKDIVEEVFSKSSKADDRVSSLFTHLNNPSQVSLEDGEINPCDSKGSPAVKEAKCDFGSKRTIRNITLIYPAGAIVVAVVLVSAFFVGSYLRQPGNVSAKMMPEQQSVNSSEIAGPLETQPLVDVQPESVAGESSSAKLIQNSTPLDWQHVIDWGLLLDEISATIPKTVQLSVIESGDGSQMFIDGRALSADALYDFVDGLSTNSQIKSAELTQTRIGRWESQDLLKFSISCALVSITKTPANVDGDYNNSGFDRSRLFASTGAEEFFGGVQTVCEQAGCEVESFLVSPKDAIFEDKETNGSITKKHAVLTLVGGYQNILKAVEKLQDRPQGVWFDSVSIHEGSGTGKLKCSMGVSVYVADSAG